MSMIIKFISSIILSIGGLLAIKNIEGRSIKVGVRQVVFLLVLAAATFLFSGIKYKSYQSLLMFLVMIVAYKEFFELDFKKATLLTSLIMILSALIDASIVLVTMNFIDLKQYHTNYLLLIICNTYEMIMMYVITRIPLVKNKLHVFVEKTISNKFLQSIIKFLFIILLLFLVSYNIVSDFRFNMDYIINLSIFALIALILIIHIRDTINYNKLLDEYDRLIEYVQTFEDWIEEEQLELHESKNNLSAIYEMKSLKEVKREIDRILNRKGSIEDNWVMSLKSVPKGGIKGLLYYKFMLAKNNKLNLVVDVSDKVKSKLNKISKMDMKLLLRLIGIFFDNAIEAAILSKEKNISLEIYKARDQINIVISNTYQGQINLNNIGKKGISTKSKNRGKGTYLANKLVSKNKNFELKNSVLNNYYIQKIIIK